MSTDAQAANDLAHRPAADGPRHTPFTADDYLKRMQRAARHAASAGVDGLVIAPGPELQYFTGYVPTAMTERPTLLILRADDAPSMLVPLLERPDFEHAAPAGRVALHTFTDGEDPYAIVAGLLREGGSYAVSDSCWALHVLGLQQSAPQASFVSMSARLPMLRAVKADEEIERLAMAAAAADSCFPKICEVRFAGRRESEVARDLAELLIGSGHSQVDFTIVASGPNGANPHHLASDRVIQQGDMVVLDFGGLMDGYGSDTTRTVHVGEPTDEERAVHELVVRAQQAAFEAVRPGVLCEQIDRIGRQVIADEGYGDRFIHRIGHGIGTTTHEPPYLVEGESQELIPGMCFSIEPGVYIPDRFGVRIEDIVVVTEDGARRLNNTPHEMTIVA
jgi:Xaa-Pro aminopeptidase